LDLSGWALKVALLWGGPKFPRGKNPKGAWEKIFKKKVVPKPRYTWCANFEPKKYNPRDLLGKGPLGLKKSCFVL